MSVKTRIARVATLALLAVLGGCAVVAPVPQAGVPSPSPSEAAHVFPGRDSAQGLEPWVTVADTAYGPDGQPRYVFDVPEQTFKTAVVDRVFLSGDQTHAVVIVDTYLGDELYWVTVGDGAAERIELTPSGENIEVTFGPSLPVALSGDGRYVTFWYELAEVLEGFVQYNYYVFVWDSKTGETARVPFPEMEGIGTSFPWGTGITNDGSEVLHAWMATNSQISWGIPAEEVPYESHSDAWLYGRQAHAVTDIRAAWSPPFDVEGPLGVQMSGDGSVLAMIGYAEDGSGFEVVVLDRESGAWTRVAHPAEAVNGVHAIGYAVMSRDASTLVLVGSTPFRGSPLNDVRYVYHYDIATGEANLILGSEVAGEQPVPEQVSADGTLTLVRVRLAGGESYQTPSGRWVSDRFELYDHLTGEVIVLDTCGYSSCD